MDTVLKVSVVEVLVPDAVQDPPDAEISYSLTDELPL